MRLPFARSRILAAAGILTLLPSHSSSFPSLPSPSPRPFGANPHSALDRLIAVLGYVLLHTGLRGGRFWYDQGPGLPDGVFQYGETIFFFDYESGDPCLEPGQRRRPWRAPPCAFACRGRAS